MIDRHRFAVVMGAFADRLNRVLSPSTAEVYLSILDEELTTDEFEAGARAVFRTHKFNTWPAPQEFIDAAKPTRPSAIDATAVIRRIERLNGYSPSSGTIPPRVDAVRTELGDLAAEAYGAVGGARLFSENPTTREIALRDFQQVLAAVAGHASAEALTQLAAPRAVQALPPGDRRVPLLLAAGDFVQ